MPAQSQVGGPEGEVKVESSAEFDIAADRFDAGQFSIDSCHLFASRALMVKVAGFLKHEI
jgi:hypothetical protein